MTGLLGRIEAALAAMALTVAAHLAFIAPAWADGGFWFPPVPYFTQDLFAVQALFVIAGTAALIALAVLWRMARISARLQSRTHTETGERS